MKQENITGALGIKFTPEKQNKMYIYDNTDNTWIKLLHTKICSEWRHDIVSIIYYYH